MIKRPFFNRAIKLTLITYLLLLSHSVFAFDGVLIHHYSFDDAWGTSGVVLDSIGGRNGAVSGNVSQVIESRNGNAATTCYAAKFNSGIINLTGLGLSESTNAQSSVSFWMKWNGAPQGMPIAWQWHDLWFYHNRFGFNSWKSNVYGISDALVNDGWVHVAAIFNNGDIGINKLYIDGELQSGLTGRVFNDDTNAYVKTAMSIGAHKNGSNFNYAFNGLIDNLNIYTGEMSPAQVIHDMNAIGSACAPPATLISQWHFDQPQWSQIDDVIDELANNHGTAINGAQTASNNPVYPGGLGSCSYGQFDGINDYVAVNNTIGNDFSISGWIYPTADFLAGTSAYQGDGLFWSDINGAGNDFIVAALRRDNKNIISFMVGDEDSASEWHLNSNTEIALNQWTHIAVTRNKSTGLMEIYVNGIFDNSLISSAYNTLSSSDNSKINIAGNTIDGNYFAGNIDEVQFYDGILSAIEINGIKNEKHACLLGPPVLDMRFDESAWPGANTILDSSGNDYHGSAFNTSPVQGIACNAADLSANGTSDYISVANGAMDGLTDFTVLVWAKSTSTQDSTILSLGRFNNGVGTNEATLYFDSNVNFWPTITAAPFNTDTRMSENLPLNDGLWHQIAWTRSAANEQSCLFFDGINKGCVDHNDGIDDAELKVIAGGFIIGQEQDLIGGGFDSAQNWVGLLDELLVFNYILDANKINEYRTNTLAGKNWDGSDKTSCMAQVNHYRIKYNAQALTCEATSVEIQACSDENCSDFYTEQASAVLSPVNGWTGGTSINFTKSIDKLLKVTSNTAITLQLGLGSLSPVPMSTNGVRCYKSNVLDSSCQLSFVETGFIFDAINTQISGKFSNVGFSAQQLTVRAVKASDNSAAACLNVFAENTTVNVDLKLNCSNPNSCLSDIVVTNNSVSSNVASIYTTIPLTFSANSTANIAIQYPDAGDISLAIKHELIAGDNTSALIGASNNFIVKPFGLHVSINDVNGVKDDNAIAENNSGSVFRKAQQDFDVTVTAVGWKADQDVNVDGQADIGKDLSSNNVVKNFINDNVRLARRKLQPTGDNTVDGTLLSTEPAFINSGSIGSVATVTASWDEVGIIGLDASLLDGQYMGVGNVTGHLENVGRFIPDHFEVSVIEQGIFDSQCSVFSYVGAKDSDDNGLITYLINPQLQITAISGIAGSLTVKNAVNYQDDFNKLNTASFTVNGPTFDNVNNNLSIVSKLVSGSVSDFEITAGNRQYGATMYELSANDNFYYVKDTASKISPFDSAIQLTVASITDQDGVMGNSLPVITPEQHEVRFGRVALLNAYGPEYSKLSMVFETQYWDGSQFVLNKDDNNCADSSTWQATLVANSTPNILATPDVISPTKNGLGLVTLNAPTSIQKMGSLEVTLDVPSWLKYNWTGSAFNKNPLATATFGRFRGNDRIINWREQR